MTCSGPSMGGGGTSCIPSKDFKTFGIKNAIKHKKRFPLDFITAPQYPPQKNLKMTVHLWAHPCVRNASSNYPDTSTPQETPTPPPNKKTNV